MAVEEIGARLSLRDRVRFRREAAEAARDVESIGQGAEKAERRSRTAFGAMGVGVSGLGGVAAKAAGAGVLALGAVGAGAVAVGVKTASANQQAEISFTTMLGSAEKAQSFLSEMKAFAATTPFEFPEIQTAASSLISAGIETSKVIPIMRTLGDVTSGMGTGSEGVKRATVAIQQMNAAGRITGEDLNQLRDAGIPVYDLLAKATGKSKEEVAGLAQAGKLGKTELDLMMKALESGAGLERFSGLMEKQSKSLAGLWSTLKDTVSMGLASAIEPLIPLLTAGLGGAITLVTPMMNGLGNAFRWATGTAQSLYSIIFQGDYTGGLGGEDSQVVDTLFDIREGAVRAYNAVLPFFHFIRDNARPILIGAGVAMGVLFGPAIIAGIVTVASVIGGALVGGIVALGAVLASPAFLLGALAAVLVKAYQSSEPLRLGIMSLRMAFSTFFAIFKAESAANGGGVRGFFAGVMAAVRLAGPLILSALGNIGRAFYEWISAAVGPALERLGGWARAIGGWILNVGLPTLVRNVTVLGGALLGWIGPQVEPALLALGAFIGRIGRWVFEIGLPRLLREAARLGAALLGWIGPQVVPALTALGSFIASIARWVVEVGLPTLGRVVLRLGTALLGWIGPQVVPALLAIGRFLGSIVDWVLNIGLPRLIASVSRWASAIWQWVEPQIPLVLGKIGSFMGALLGWVVGTGLPLLVGGMLKLSYELVKWVAPRVPGLLLELGKLLASILGWIITEGIPSLIKGMFNFGVSAVRSFGDAITKSPLVTTLAGYFGGIINTVKTSISDMWRGLKTIFFEGVRYIVDSFAGGVEKIFELGAKIPGPLGTAFREGLGKVREFRVGFNAEMDRVADEEVNVTAVGHVKLSKFSEDYLKQNGAFKRPHEAFAGGGHVRGPGSWTSDRIPAMLSDNEYVVKARSVAKYGTGFLDSVNSGDFPVQQFKHGGIVHPDQTMPGLRFANGHVNGVVDQAETLAGIHAKNLAHNVADKMAAGLNDASAPAPMDFGGGPSRGTGDQMSNARIIDRIGRSMGMGFRGSLVAIMTAMQESGMRNIKYGDRDSIGLFQQRPSQGWGTVAQIMNPEYSSRKFFQALRGVRGWERMPLTVAAQRVQRSAFPNAYAKHEEDARWFLARLRGGSGDKRRDDGPIARGNRSLGGNVRGATRGVNLELLRRLASVASASRDPVVVNSGYRSMAAQQRLYNLYLQGRNPLTAKPGTSWHQFRGAVDARFASGRTMRSREGMLRKYGLWTSVPSEHWHVQRRDRSGAADKRRMLSEPYFDQGGLARGVGMLPKRTILPERVLSPQQTASFERLVDDLGHGRVNAPPRATVEAESLGEALLGQVASGSREPIVVQVILDRKVLAEAVYDHTGDKVARR